MMRTRHSMLTTMPDVSRLAMCGLIGASMLTMSMVGCALTVCNQLFAYTHNGSLIAALCWLCS